jgi:L-asparaginase II
VGDDGSLDWPSARQLGYDKTVTQTSTHTEQRASELAPPAPALSAPESDWPVVVEVTRGREIESVHRGAIVVMTGDGDLVATLGRGSSRVFYRSAAKVFQAIPLIELGAAERYRLTPVELAVIIGSHSGEAIHREVVRSILAKADLAVEALQCGTHMPFDEGTAKALRAAGAHPDLLHNNCSGKHAGMLVLARHLGAPIETYLDPTHPIQQMILARLAQFAAVREEEVGVAVDGCSAPVFAVPLQAMARSYGNLVAPTADLPERTREAARQVVAAMVEAPEMVGGTRLRLDTDLMRALPGQIVSKVGAEGVQLLGLLPCPRYPRGLGIAIKIEDGDIRRARDPVVLETLRQLGLFESGIPDSLAAYAYAQVINHRRLQVGEVRPAFALSFGARGSSREAR